MDQAVNQRRISRVNLWRLIQRYGALLLVFATVTGVCFLFAGRKSGMFIDEIYTYGLSNSHYAPFVREVAGGSLADRVLTRQDLQSYLVVDPGEGLDFGSVYYNQVRDVHPPLYYWLFNIASSLTPGVFSKWTGLVLDYILYMLALALLVMLAKKLFASRYIAVAAAAIYGLSVIGMSTMLMIRMYVLLTALTVGLSYLAALFLDKRRLLTCPLIGLCVFLGLMTQYYFVFYAFFLCGFLVLYLLFTKEWKQAAVFSVCAFGGVALLLLIFPACLRHLFADSLVSGGNAVENLTNVSQYVSRLTLFSRDVLHRRKAAVYIALLAVAALALCWRKLTAALKAKAFSFTPLLIILPAFLAFLLVAVISPVAEIRYVYNLAPLFVLAVCYLLYMLERSLGEMRFAWFIKTGAVLLIWAVALWEARCLPPDYLYPEHNDYNAAITEYSDAPCVYMTGYIAPITQDLLQLMIFDDFFVTEDPASPALDAYLESHGDPAACVVYIDISSFWSSGFDVDEMIPLLLEDTYFTGYERLYQYGLSDTYLLTTD